MPILRGNLHAHTTFSDGRHTVEEVVARYRDLGYDFLAITDHDDRVSEDYWFRIPAGDDRLMVLSGIELDYRPLGQHVGRITADRETLFVLNHPARYGLDVDEIVDRIRLIRAGRLAHRGDGSDQYRRLSTAARRRRHRRPQGGDRRLAPGSECGRAWIELDAARNADAILRAVKAGDFRLGFAAEPPEAEGRGFDLLGLSR